MIADNHEFDVIVIGSGPADKTPLWRQRTSARER